MEIQLRLLSRAVHVTPVTPGWRDTTREKRWGGGVNEADVLDRVHQGLREGGIDLDAAQAQWVIHRLAELLEWPWTPVPPGGA